MNEDWERQFYKNKMSQLHDKMEEKSRKRPYGVRKKVWKKRKSV